MSDVVNIFSIPSSPSSALSTLLPTLTTVLTTIGTIVAAALGATIFKWYESWHNAELASRALSGLTSNFARHCIYNMIRITQIYSRSPSEFLSDTLLQKQKFVLYIVSDATKDRMQLIGTDLIFRFEALFLRLRNFNIEIEFALKNKTANEDLKKVLDYIFFRNLQLVEASHKLANDFDKLIKDSKNINYSTRLFYIWKHRGTIFNKNDFQPCSVKKYEPLSSQPFIDTVDSILKIYLEYEGSEAGEYSSMIQTYNRINLEYNGDQSEWFGVKWTKR